MLDWAAMGPGFGTLVTLLLVATATPVIAAKSVTVEQFGQWTAAERGKSDGKIAKQISGMELSERASEAKLTQWEAVCPGPRTRDALIALADASRFLAPPAAEIPQKPAPDLVAQQTMLSTAVEYVSKTLTKLPDFSATRETMHFEDKPPMQQIEGSPGLQTFSQRGLRQTGLSNPTPRFLPGEPIHFVAQSSVLVTYRDGLEVRDTQNLNAEKTEAVEGFTTSGEFGPILSVIVGDAVHSDVRWGYWDQNAATPQAVFRYSVPQEQSHFTVALPNAQQTVTLSPPYHGEIAIDPATGGILRLTVISDLQPPYQQVQVAIMVEYASVEIGAQTYLCPVRGVALSKIPVVGASGNAKHPVPVETRLNDVSFTHYHLFRAETKILP